jgi:hypothetical protein
MEFEKPPAPSSMESGEGRCCQVPGGLGHELLMWCWWGLLESHLLQPPRATSPIQGACIPMVGQYTHEDKQCAQQKPPTECSGTGIHNSVTANNTKAVSLLFETTVQFAHYNRIHLSGT